MKNLTKAVFALAAAVAALTGPARGQTSSQYPTIPYTQLQSSDFILLEGTRFTVPVYTTMPIMAQWLQANMGIPNFSCAALSWAQGATSGIVTCTPFPALTADVSSSSGTTAVTVNKIQGTSPGANVVAAFGNAANGAGGFPTVDGAAPAKVDNNTRLSALPAAFAASVLRLGYAAPGDAPPVLYTPSSSACSLNAGAGDGGSQVPASDGNCWIASLPQPADVRIWGCPLDGITDGASCVNSIQNGYAGPLLIPASAGGLYVGAASTLTIKTRVTGSAFQAHSQFQAGGVYPGLSWIKCALPRAQSCVAAGVAGVSPVVEKLIVAGQGTPSVGGGAGLQIADGTSVTTRDILISNFDTCLLFGPESATGALHFKGYNINAGACQTHYIVNDGWPEAYFIGGRFGQNGNEDYSAASDYVYQTRTGAIGAGGGPNTMTFDGVQFNTGSGGVGCAFNWGGFTGSGGLSGIFKLSNSHVEWHSYAGAGKTGVFCSDSTVPKIQTVQISNSDISQPYVAFNLDPLTALQKFYITGSNIDCASTTLAPTPASGYSMQDVHIANSAFFCPLSITVTGAGNTFSSVGSKYGAWTIAGPWASFQSVGDYSSSFTSASATGKVNANPATNVSWTPILNFGGATTGNVQTQSGLWQRTPEGGFRAYFLITLTTKGSATGNATITGLPVTCASSPSSIPLTSGSTMTGVTGVPLAKTNGSSATVSLQQAVGTGLANLTDANFANGTVIAATVRCETAQ